MTDIRDTIENTYGNLSQGDKAIINSITNKNTDLTKYSKFTFLLYLCNATLKVIIVVALIN